MITSINEFKKINEAKKPLDFHINKLGQNPTVKDLAEYIDNNYNKVTGLKSSAKYDEGHWPNEIVELTKHYGIDPDDDDFQEAWQF